MSIGVRRMRASTVRASVAGHKTRVIGQRWTPTLKTITPSLWKLAKMTLEECIAWGRCFLPLPPPFWMGYVPVAMMLVLVVVLLIVALTEE